MKNVRTTCGSSTWSRAFLPFVACIALLVPASAAAGVKLEASDAVVKVPAAVFGVAQPTAVSGVDEVGDPGSMIEPGSTIENASWSGLPGLPGLLSDGE